MAEQDTSSSTHSTDPGTTTDRAQVLTFLALIAAPILAVVSAGMGLVLILTERTIAGVIFILIPTQAFLALGIWAYTARKRNFSHSSSPSQSVE
ncbi:NF038396 family protein [Auritidibacter sp. NML100628]|uniref:NF038396 family protein n=1 Tax=Auritidibacter sp. NML100628 TaxID=2170742 RepID=UPI001F2775F2|nr:NF038396 family protein [Auritidibacter sp. NML100628]